MAEALIRKVLLIGWDAADWKVISPLVDAGKMPHLENFINAGVIGNLATLYPDLSPMLWTSIATGKRPFKNGILGFVEPDPGTGGIRPITNLSRRTKAVWNILSQTGRKCNVIGWWPSHPAEPINGVMVSNRYQKAVGPIDKPWPIRPGTVHPVRLVKNLEELRWHPQKLDSGHIHPFVPRFLDVDQDQDHRLETLAKTISECLSIEAAALALMHHEPWDFTAVYFDGIDHFCHGFMRYQPPRANWVNEKDFELYSQVVESGYILHDILLGRLMEKAGEEATVILVSDHGFQSGSLRPRHIPREPAGPAIMHRRYGVFAMKGPGIKKDERIYGASLLDVCPTILSLFGLPVALDMDGKPLVGAFESPPAIHTIASWDEVDGPAGTHPPDIQIDPVDASEAINQLVALGYIEKPSDDREQAVANAVRELRYNLARSYMDANRYGDAMTLLEELLGRWPDEYRFGIQLVSCYQAMGWLPNARRVLEDLFRRKEQNVFASREKLRQFEEERKDRKPEDLSEHEVHQLRNLRGRASWNPFAMEYLLGSLLFSEGDEQTALEHLKRAENADPGQPGLYLKLGAVYARMKRWKDAELAFNKAVDLDPDCAEAYRGLALSYLNRHRNEEAAEAALNAVGRIYFDPMSHFLLGVALHRLNHIPRALEALRVAVLQSPNYPQAHRRLSLIYKDCLFDTEKAAKHHVLAKEAARRIRNSRRKQATLVQGEPKETHDVGVGNAFDFEVAKPDLPLITAADLPIALADLQETIVVVTGLPRSGTSMMMQMLAAGGMSLLTDGKREPDDLNPRGYFEFEPAKSLKRDSSWLPTAKGRAVKIVAQLLAHLSPEMTYRVIFMEREMEEILRSQKRMLAHQSKRGANLADEKLAQIFCAQIVRAKQMLFSRRVPSLYISYGKTLESPQEVAARINAFLGGELDESRIVSAVDAKLKTVTLSKGV
jgi:tetratricopeptide (TPR) repeat protein